MPVHVDERVSIVEHRVILMPSVLFSLPDDLLSHWHYAPADHLTMNNLLLFINQFLFISLKVLSNDSLDATFVTLRVTGG